MATEERDIPQQPQTIRPRDTGSIGDEEDWVWMENLRREQSNFTQRATGLVFRMEPHGYVGSVIEVPSRVARDPYIRRAQRNGIIGFLAKDEAFDRMDTLIVPEDSASDQRNLLQEALEAGASKQAGKRYRNPNLPEEAEQRAPITKEQVWGQKPIQPALGGQAPAPVSPADREGLPEATQIDKPLAPAEVMTERAKEGDSGFPTVPERS